MNYDVITELETLEGQLSVALERLHDHLINSGGRQQALGVALAANRVASVMRQALRTASGSEHY